MSVGMEIKGLKLKLSEVEKGQWKLMSHQAKIEDAKEKIVFLSSPTGGGKTVAVLLSALKQIAEDELGILVYPTKELIKDQLNSILNSLSKMGYKAAQMMLNKSLEPVSKEGDENAEIWVVAVDADSLEMFARGRTHGETLNRILQFKEGTKLLILTNPDILWTVFKGLFHRSRKILGDLFSHLSFIAMDEMHLYNGFSLQTVLTMLWMLRNKYRRLVISTATHLNEIVNLVKGLGNHEIIESVEDPNGNRIRYDCQLETSSLTSRASLWKPKEAEAIVEKVKEMYKNSENKPNPKVLVIVNSVIFADYLADILCKEIGEDKVSRIHGFVPHTHRKTDVDIVVGTKAIEVGIDFDAQNLIFEANNATDFIQRFGRVCRHREGKAVAYVPGDELLKMRKFLEVKFKTENSKYEIRYKTLEKIINKCFPEPKAYSEFIKSQYGYIVHLGIVNAVAEGLGEALVRDNRRRTREIVERLITETEKFGVPPYLQNFTVKEVDFSSLRNLLKLTTKRFRKLLEAISKAGARGPLLLIPAFFEKYKEFAEISLQDLNKVVFTIYKGKKIPEKYRGDVVVQILELNINHDVGITTKERGLFIFEGEGESNFGVFTGDPLLSKSMKEVLKGNIAFTVVGRPYDWRFFALKNKATGGYTVIGPDALIQAFLTRAGAYG